MNEAAKLLLLGCGGHALVVAESAMASGIEIYGFLDDDPETCENAATLNLKLLGGLAMLDSIVGNSASSLQLHAAVGNNKLRKHWMSRAQSNDLINRFAPIIHPSAIVSPSANLGLGTFIGPNVVINAKADIGEGVIINTSAVIEHECVIGSFTHVAPRVVMGGACRIDSACLLGIGAVIRPQTTIGARTTVGAGSVVVATSAILRLFFCIPAGR